MGDELLSPVVPGPRGSYDTHGNIGSGMRYAASVSSIDRKRKSAVLNGGGESFEVVKLDELLRSATQPQHERLHQVVDLKQMTQSPELYAAALGAYWNAVAPLELALSERLALCREETLLPDFPARLQKHTWLRADLTYLGRSADLSVPSGGPVLTSLRDTTNPLAWLAGCGYVMEGMTLGATRIAKLVEQALGFQQETGARFFNSYGAETGPMWQAYRHWLRETDVDADTVVEAAQQTFAHFEQRLADWPLSGKGPSLYA